MRASRIFFFILMVLGQTGALASEVCSAVHHRVIHVAPEKIQQASELIEKVYSGNIKKAFLEKQKPNWAEYAEVAQLLEFIQKNPRIRQSIDRYRLKAKFKNERESIEKSLKEGLSDPEKKKSFNRHLDYHFAYFHLLKKANEDLGVEIFPVPDHSGLKPNRQMIKEAEQLVARLEFYAKDTFEATGHKDKNAFIEYTRNFGKHTKRKLKLVQDELVIAMHRPENARFWIPLAGFQNQRITGSSNGSLFHEMEGEVTGRDQAEANLTNQTTQDFVPLSPRFKPNYAEARPDVNVKDIQRSTNASGYGSDLWIFKKNAVEKRATWTPADSLGPGQGGAPKSHIQNIFLPWSYRELMVPYSVDPSVFEPAPPNPGFNFKSSGWPWSWAGYYFEVQIWGPLTIKDVQAFHFMENPPDKKLYDLLVSEGIEVWDERQWPATRYFGEAAP